jgi:hypothetical protein
VWNRKLEKEEPEERDVDSKKPEESQQLNEQEALIEDMFKKLNQGGKISNRANSAAISRKKDEVLMQDILAFRDKEPAKDDQFFVEKTTGEFGDNQYWKVSSTYDIDDLIAEMDNS